MTEPTSIDQDAKLRIRAALIDHAAVGLNALSGGEDGERRAGRLDHETSLEVDDTSHSYEAGDLEGLFEDAADHARERLEEIRRLDFTHTDRVGPGAIVGFGGDRYVVGVATGPFECDGVTYQGIGTDSPVLPHLQGKEVGSTFTFNGQEQRVDFVA